MEVCKLCRYRFDNYVSWVKAGMPLPHFEPERYEQWLKTQPPAPSWWTWCRCNW